ncbi:hypothetical protein PLICRDRAFT_178656 [Plicaturopsis crispa FD-325 SS-3]|nr:hypothetical protein PLICRDRAFT_178656 [Plicaturopsis crispa FD-325 SS-3]
MENLSAEQQRALAQLQVLTDGGDDQAAIGVLSSVGWDVQRAADIIFEPTPAPRREAMEIDDSGQGEHVGRGPRPSRRLFPSNPRSIWSLFAYPLHLLSSIFRFFFGVLRIPIPQLRFSSLNFYRPLRSGPSDPHSAADRWVRALEEETGGVCVSRARAAASRAVAASGADAGPSTLTSRSGANGFDEGKTPLPDFTIGSYEDVLRTCQRDARIACVILVSEEHDDVPEFKRTTLTNPRFVNTLQENDIVVWGGDVRDQDAWSAAQKLQVTTYPFVAFLALQPRRSPSSTTSRTAAPPVLTILSRHQGRCVPDTAPTSAHTLTDHLERQLLPRVKPFLDRIQASARERERDRLLREEQDRAFKDSARRDKERIEAKMAEERRLAAERQQREAEEREEAERARRLEEEARKRAVVRMDWRRWSRRALPAPPEVGTKEDLRLAIKLPGNARCIRYFSPTATLTGLYAFVDAQLVPEHLSPDDDPEAPPQGSAIGEAALERQIRQHEGHAEGWWGFKLVLAYPRREILWEAGKTLASVEGLDGGAQLVVELIIEPGRRDSGEADTESDGYSTESD